MFGVRRGVACRPLAWWSGSAAARAADPTAGDRGDAAPLPANAAGRCIPRDPAASALPASLGDSLDRRRVRLRHPVLAQRAKRRSDRVRPQRTAGRITGQPSRPSRPSGRSSGSSPVSLGCVDLAATEARPSPGPSLASCIARTRPAVPAMDQARRTRRGRDLIGGPTRRFPRRPKRCSRVSGPMGVGQGWICEPYPRSRRIDSRMMNALLAVKTSAAARTPVYFAMTGAAAKSLTASR